MVVGIRRPATAAEIAARWGITEATLDRLLRRGMLRRLPAEPDRYVRNDDYLVWRRAARLADDYTPAALEGKLAAVRDRIGSLAARYPVDRPDAAPVAAVAATTDREPERVRDGLGAWQTALAKEALYATALARSRGPSADVPQ